MPRTRLVPRLGHRRFLPFSQHRMGHLHLVQTQRFVCIERVAPIWEPERPIFSFIPHHY
jgi:hypothetical protein